MLALLAGFGLALKLYGERHLDEMTERFTREVGPIPEIQYTPDGSVQLSEDPTQDVLARMREGRAAGDAALAALRLGDRERALELLGDVASERDACFAHADLPAQIIGVTLGEKVQEVSRAFVEQGPLAAGEMQALSAMLDVDSMEGWRRTLAHEAGLAYSWTNEVEKVSGAEGVIVRLQEPFTIAAALGLYLGLHEAVRDDVADVDAHVRATHEDAVTAAWLSPAAAILVPNLVDMAVRRRDYRADLDAMRLRVESLGGTTDSV